MRLYPPNVKVEQNADGTAKATLELYALALMATREDRGRFELHQEASWTYAPTDQVAHDEGLRQAEEKWPAKEGWALQAAIRKVTVHIDLLKK
jgi:hypothetical protein